MSKVDNFLYHTPIPAKIWGCSLWSRSLMMGCTETGKVRLISREIIFEVLQHDHDTSTLESDGRTDRRTQTTYLGNTALRFAR